MVYLKKQTNKQKKPHQNSPNQNQTSLLYFANYSFSTH